MLDVQYVQASDPGKIRTNNEDAMGCFIPASRHQARSHGFLFAVADGVGGLELGEVASATAVATVTKEFAEAQSGSMLTGLMPRLVQHANAATPMPSTLLLYLYIAMWCAHRGIIVPRRPRR